MPLMTPTEAAAAKSFPRAEIEETMQRWLDANEKAEATGDWITHLGPFYTDDAVYRWNVGPNEEFEAKGKKAIEELDSSRPAPLKRAASPKRSASPRSQGAARTAAASGADVMNAPPAIAAT